MDRKGPGMAVAASALLWFVTAVACIAILVWFLLFSGYGNPPEFVYEQF